MRTKSFLCSIIALAILLPAAGWADKPESKEHPMTKKWAKLGLNPQQEAKLKELHKQTAPARKEQMKNIEALRGEIKQELLKEKPSRTALDNYAARMGDLHKQMNVLSIDHLLKVKEILTPEQFARFTDHKFMDGAPHKRRYMDKEDGKGEPGQKKYGGKKQCELEKPEQK